MAYFSSMYSRNFQIEKRNTDIESNAIISVQFNDNSRTVFVFRVQKKLNILSLRAMAAARVAQCFQKNAYEIIYEQVTYLLQKIEDIEKIESLEIPKDLIPDVQSAFLEELKLSTYSRYLYKNTCCLCCSALHIANHWWNSCIYLNYSYDKKKYI